MHWWKIQGSEFQKWQTESQRRRTWNLWESNIIWGRRCANHANGCVKSPATFHISRVDSTRWILNASTDCGIQFCDFFTSCDTKYDTSSYRLFRLRSHKIYTRIQIHTHTKKQTEKFKIHRKSVKCVLLHSLRPKYYHKSHLWYLLSIML